MVEYINLKYKPLRNDLICEYYVEPHQGITLEKAAEYIAAESSIGTWTDISTMNPEIAFKLRPSVFYINKSKRTIKIAYPSELFEGGSVPQIMSSIGGNIFGMKAVNNLRLIDVDLPKNIIKTFKGPKYGVQGIRNLTKIKNRPLTGTIVKPKISLNETQYAKVAFNSWIGGLDIVKDDENLTDLKFNRFKERVIKTLEQRDKAEEETGEKKIYIPNITSETDKMIERADFVRDHGGEYIMIDILTTGWAGLQTIRNLNLPTIIHGHRAGHGAFTRNHKHGISMLTIAKLARLIGVDQLHIGAVVGKMDGSAIEVHEIEEEIDRPFIAAGKKTHLLEQSWHGIKPVLPVASGGLHPGLVPQLMKLMGKNIICQFGGGCHGHPDGTVAGAKAIRQAVDIVMKRKSFDITSKKMPELKKALRKFGRT